MKKILKKLTMFGLVAAMMLGVFVVAASCEQKQAD